MPRLVVSCLRLSSFDCKSVISTRALFNSVERSFRSASSLTFCASNSSYFFLETTHAERIRKITGRTWTVFITRFFSKINISDLSQPFPSKLCRRTNSIFFFKTGVTKMQGQSVKALSQFFRSENFLSPKVKIKNSRMAIRHKLLIAGAFALSFGLTSCDKDDNNNGSQLSRTEAKSEITAFNNTAKSSIQNLANADGLQAVKDFFQLVSEDDPFGRIGTDERKIRTFLREKGTEFK